MSIQRKIYTLTQLNTSLERHFQVHFGQQTFWITAELIKINEKNRNFYLELADSIDDLTTARSYATIWSTQYQAIAGKVGVSDLKSILQPGNRVLFHVKIEYHKAFGLKLNIHDIDASYSYGEIERKRQDVIKRLKKELIFDRQGLLRLPTIIKRIALIGSPETSGFRDFKNELFNNHNFNKFVIKIFPVRVQGNIAAGEIVKAIQTANEFDAEVIVIIRGGGSKMDLALFDDYAISKAICLSRLPVLTGIGHETDEVVADLVARQHFITPTAVARFIHYGIASFQEIMRELHDRVMQKSLQTLGSAKDEFMHYNNYLSHYSRELINFWRNVFQENEYLIYQRSRTLLYGHKDSLASFIHRVSSNLSRIVQSEESTLLHDLDKIATLSYTRIEDERKYNLNQTLSTLKLLSEQLVEREMIVVHNLEDLVSLLNPQKILARGYTISTINDKNVKDIEVKIGDEMKTLSPHYLLTSKIIEKEDLKHEDNR